MKKPPPTKEEIKAARALLKEGRAKIREAYKVLGRRHLIKSRRVVTVSLKERLFRTWSHDVSVLAHAVARTPGAHTWSPAELVAHASAAADRMAHEVDARRPEDESLYAHRVWHDWQNTFDNFVHDLANRTELDAQHVIDRAAALTDAMMKMIAKRKKR